MDFDPELVKKVTENLMRVPGEKRYQWKFAADSDSLVGAQLGVSTKMITKIRNANGWNLHSTHFDNQKGKRKPRRKTQPAIVFTGEKTVAEKLNPTPKPIVVKAPPEAEGPVTRKQHLDVVDRLNQMEQKHAALLARLGG